MRFDKINGRLSGQDVYILGSGPSLTGFDLNRLNGKNVIAVNHSIEIYPAARYLIFGDSIFMNKTTFDFSTYTGIVATATRNHDGKNIQCIPEERLYLFEPVKKDPQLSAKDKKLFHPCSSGIMALNWAIQMKAENIYLLGFDYVYKNGITHFFGNIYQHHLTFKEERVSRKAEKFKNFTKLKKNIYNCSDISIIEDFPKIGLNQI